MKHFAKTVSIDGLVQLSALLTTNGYTGSFGLAQLTIKPASGTVYRGHNNTLDASNGAPTDTTGYTYNNLLVDAAEVYLFTASAINVGITAVGQY